jgi:H+-transporting ATPase
VLIEPELQGVVVLIKEGQATFQRILTYTLRSIIHNVVQVLFFA